MYNNIQKFFLQDVSIVMTIVFSIVAFIIAIMITSIIINIKHRKKMINILKSDDKIPDLMNRYNLIMHGIRSTFEEHGFIKEHEFIHDSTIIKLFEEANQKRNENNA